MTQQYWERLTGKPMSEQNAEMLRKSMKSVARDMKKAGNRKRYSLGET